MTPSCCVVGDRLSITSQPRKPIDDFVEQFVSIQLAADRAMALSLVDQLLGDGYSVPDILTGLVQTAQYELGRLWERDEITVADEHIGTGVAQVVVNRLYEQLRRSASPAGHVLVACVEGELHDLGPRIVADLFEYHGFRVTFLGANVPTDSLMHAIRRDNPDAVLLSATMSWNVPQIARIAQRCADEGLKTILIAGGHGLNWLDINPEELANWTPIRDPIDAIATLGRQLDDGAAV